MRLRAAVVDDEAYGRENLSFLLQQYCPDVEVVGMADSSASARELMEREELDILFLDINMPGESGLALLESFENSNLQVVFVTAYEQYSIRAIKAGAFDYILKPIDIDELQQTVEKLVKRQEYRLEQRLELERFYQSKVILPLPQKNEAEKINIPHSKGIKVVSITDIIRLTADNNYTDLYIKNQQKLVVSRTLKDFEDTLDPEMFFRIHKSHIINIAHVKEYYSEDNGYVIMSDGVKIEISRRRSPAFIQFLTKAYKELKKS